MSAYMVINFLVKDMSKLKAYGEKAAETLLKFDGRYLAKGPNEVVHGAAKYPMTVIISFPDREKATDWYNSKDYQSLIPIRNEAFDGDFLLIGEST